MLGLPLPAEVAAFAAVLLLGLLAVLRATGWWSFRLGLVVGLVLVGSLGWWIAPDARAGFREAVRATRGLELLHPWWLVLLAVVPGIVLVARRNLRGLGPTRKWLAISLRSLVV